LSGVHGQDIKQKANRISDVRYYSILLKENKLYVNYKERKSIVRFYMTNFINIYKNFQNKYIFYKYALEIKPSKRGIEDKKK
jgi:hypothetical protein